MQERETIISGAVPPKKRKKSIANIVGIILLLVTIIAVAYFLIVGKANGFAKKTLAIAAQSWNQVLGMSGETHIVTEVSIEPGATPNNEPSSTADFGQVSSSESKYVPPGKVKKPATKTSKGQSTVSHVSSPPEIAATAAVARSGSVRSQASTSEMTSTDPMTIADNNPKPLALPEVLHVAPSFPGKLLQCSVSGVSSSNVAPRVILNEIAWMGSPTTTGETAAKAANREWIELKNITQAEIDLAGWQIIGSAGNVGITFGPGDKIDPGTFYLLSRDGNAVQGMSSDKAYSGGLSNSGETLAVFDASCGVSDALDASQGWPGGDNSTKQTLERKVGGAGWQTSLLTGGTPHGENSVGAAPVVSSASLSSSTYAVSVMIAGDGAGKITSKPAGISCGSTAPTAGTSVCTAEYQSGTSLTLTATPGSNVTFAGWTGPCSGTGSCSFSVGGMVSASAQFKSIPSLAFADDSASLNLTDSDSQSVPSAGVGEASSTDSTIVASSTPLSPSTSSSTSEDQTASLSTSTPVASLTHLVIAQIQLAGASSANDFVKIYNPTAMPVDLGGWKLRKKSSTGTDSSLRALPKGSVIVPGAYFTWANSLNGFAQLIGADASSTETLSANNSVAIFDANGATVDAVAWGTGTNQYGEGIPYPQNPAPSQILARKSSDAVLVDTKNNADDFTLQ